MIVVIDSCVWISALEFGGTPDKAVLLAVAIDRIAVSLSIREEVAKALSRKFGWSESRIERRLGAYWNNALWVTLDGSVSGICRDPDDDAILECAEKANADLIVTGDRDLLALGSYGAIRIVTAREYVEGAGGATA